MQHEKEAEVKHLRSLPTLDLEPATPMEAMIERMRSALSRNLPQVQHCRPHRHRLCVLAGGPSLAETYQFRDGYAAAVNGSLRWLMERDVIPNACGLLDPGEHLADLIEVNTSVRYFVASICHPKVFDKLIGGGCQVVLWHASGSPAFEELLRQGPDGWSLIAGGPTMGLRWYNLGYFLGFRSFAFHGLDSSFRDGATHAYPDRADAKDRIAIAGRETRLNFLSQVQYFFKVLDRFGYNDMEPTRVEIYGEGLLQDAVDCHLRERGELFGVRATLRRNLAGIGCQTPVLAA